MASRPELQALASVADLGRAIRALVDAFDGYPLTEWVVLRDERHSTRLATYVREMVDLATPGGHGLIDAQGRAAALWLPWDRPEPGVSAVLRRLPLIPRVTGWRRLPSRLRGLATLSTDHPLEPHAYLSMLGVRKEDQRSGIGTALLRAGLARSDTAGVGAFLHTSNPDAIPFYTRHGFEIRGEALRLPDGPEIWRLWRAPSASSYGAVILTR
jgi:ribosomal protein S18 acetylase RimI-like enzyme